MSRAAVAHVPSIPGRDSERVKVYVWEIPVRACHWLIFVSILVLSVTGFYIGKPFVGVFGEARLHHVMATMRVLHFYAAIVFVTAVVVRVIWLFTGNMWAQWHQFMPVDKRRVTGFFKTIKYYSFLALRPPYTTGHNPVAGASYLAIFGLFFLEILTGFAMYSVVAPVGSVWRKVAFLAPIFGGLQLARWIHHVIMWLLLGFLVHHVYSAWLTSIIEKTGCMESIFSGYKFVPTDEYEEERDYVMQHHSRAHD
jgi:Ni/Fe-hydrogenase 1 B-type cytochrome subunit